MVPQAPDLVTRLRAVAVIQRPTFRSSGHAQALALVSCSSSVENDVPDRDPDRRRHDRPRETGQHAAHPKPIKPAHREAEPTRSSESLHGCDADGLLQQRSSAERMMVEAGISRASARPSSFFQLGLRSQTIEPFSEA